MHKRVPANPPEKSVELPKAYDPKTVEDAIYASWEKSGFFNPDALPGKRLKPFTVMMPPPNATGTLHVGHAMFMTLQDIMTRFERMRGKAALWLPGTDHAAIATNTKVEKILQKEGKTKYDLGRELFVKKVEAYVAGSQSTIRKQIRKMGSSCDWSREAYTLDETRSRAVREMFRRMYEDGLIYRGNRIVNWCPRCESTLADDEVEYKEEPAELVYLKYGPFIVATTRPESKLGDTAVAVHPGDGRYKKYVGTTFNVDFGIGPQEIRVIADKGVDPNFGSGALGVTPAHSAVDFAMAEKNHLPIKKVIGEDGKMTKLAGKYAGLTVLEARKKFVEDLTAAGLVEKTEEIKHNLTVCYRCGTAVEPLTSRQWFVDVNRKIPKYKKSLKSLALEAVRTGKTEIIPERFEKTYFHWMENLRDWCISRQIWFGHRVPVWYCRECFVEDGEGKEGIVVSTEPPLVCPWCKRRKDLTSFTQDPDTLDTWFSSGTWTFSTLGWPDKTEDLKRFHPTQVLETGYDIIFFWVARMILMTAYALGEVPFERVYLHGLVRDEKGRKMSKSLENIIDPLDVADKYGTDAVRLSLVIGNTAGNDLKLSEEKIAYFRNFTNKLWNIGRFVSMQVGPMKRAKRPAPKTLADKWILARLDATIREVTKSLDGLNFSQPGEALRDFTWNDLADWYLEIAKIEKGKEAMLSYLLETILKLWHPFMPFVTESLYRQLFSAKPDDYLMVASWPKPGSGAAGKRASDFDLVRGIIVAVRNIRATYKVEPGRQIDAQLIAGKRAAALKKQAAVIAGLARVRKLDIVAKGRAPAQSASAVVGTVKLAIPLGSLVDVSAEKAKLEGELVNVERYLRSLESRLANPDFLARAPAKVVEAERAKLEAGKQRAKEIAAQLGSLTQV